MTFEEFKLEYGAEDAFADWKPVSLVKQLKIIPDLPGYEKFPNTCLCGSEVIIKNGLTQMMCCNPECPEKLPFRLAKLFKSFGIKNIGVGICRNVYKSLTKYDQMLKSTGQEGIFYYDTYLEVLCVPFDKYPMEIRSIQYYDFSEACKEVLAAQVTFPELISKTGLKGMDEGLAQIFSQYNSYEELISDIEKYGINQFCVNHGIYATSRILDIKLALPHILFLYIIKQQTIRMQGMVKVNVCMTGSVIFQGKRYTKAEFLELCNQESKIDGYQVYEFKLNSAVNSNEFVLYSTPSNSSKFRIASQRGEITGEFGTHPVLMQVEDFFELLHRRLQDWKQAMASQTI